MSRAHSKYSASGTERWFQCSASVEAQEGLPDKTSKWAEEGTEAHAILELILQSAILSGAVFIGQRAKDMERHAFNAANFIFDLGNKLGAQILVESRVWLTFIHKEAFGTLDAAILDHFGTLHVFDFKYGAGHAVSPTKNLQMIFYALALAHKYQWNFARVRLWIIQPRIRGYDGPAFWDISIEELRSYIPKFKEAVWRVENKPEFKEGPWCHWCKAKKTPRCPFTDTRKSAIAAFKSNPLKENSNGHQEEKTKTQTQSAQKSEADWRKKEKSKPRRSGYPGRGRRGRRSPQDIFGVGPHSSSRDEFTGDDFY